MRENGNARRTTARALFATGTALALVSAGSLAAIWLAQHPDAVRRIHMRIALSVKSQAHNRADYWRNVADKAGTRYNQLKA